MRYSSLFQCHAAFYFHSCSVVKSFFPIFFIFNYRWFSLFPHGPYHNFILAYFSAIMNCLRKQCYLPFCKSYFMLVSVSLFFSFVFSFVSVSKEYPSSVHLSSLQCLFYMPFLTSAASDFHSCT